MVPIVWLFIDCYLLTFLCCWPLKPKLTLPAFLLAGWLLPFSRLLHLEHHCCCLISWQQPMVTPFHLSRQLLVDCCYWLLLIVLPPKSPCCCYCCLAAWQLLLPEPWSFDCKGQPVDYSLSLPLHCNKSQVIVALAHLNNVFSLLLPLCSVTVLLCGNSQCWHNCTVTVS